MPQATYLVASVALGVAGQILLKYAVLRIGALHLGRRNAPAIVRRFSAVPALWMGLIVYGASALLWIVGLSHAQLGYAYPFISLSYVLILVASWRLFHEEITPVRLLGVALICGGVYVIAGS